VGSVRSRKLSRKLLRLSIARASRSTLVTKLRNGNGGRFGGPHNFKISEQKNLIEQDGHINVRRAGS
jgi:hypothetical protein